MLAHTLFFHLLDPPWTTIRFANPRAEQINPILRFKPRPEAMSPRYQKTSPAR